MEQVEEMQRVQDQFDQRPEDEVRAERIARLFDENPRCNRCGVIIESVDDGDVAILSKYPRLVHRGECPHVARESVDGRAALRSLFPDADFSGNQGKFRRVTVGAAR